MNLSKRSAASLPLFALTLGTGLFGLATGCGKAHPPFVAAQVSAASPAVSAASLAASAAPGTVPGWPASSVIYTLYPQIFSPQGNFAGVTAQLPRLRKMGVTDV